MRECLNPTIQAYTYSTKSLIFPIHSGAGRGSTKAPDIDPQDMRVMIATNFEGLVNMTQAVLPTFLKRPNGGRGDVINIGSVAGRDPYPNSSIYCATKAAVRSFTETLRREFIASQIRFIEIAPGQVKTVGPDLGTVLRHLVKLSLRKS
jgi:3-hydroxy acid dehydrogenase / malonic semialdehyde reductase